MCDPKELITFVGIIVDMADDLGISQRDLLELVNEIWARDIVPLHEEERAKNPIFKKQL